MCVKTIPDGLGPLANGGHVLVRNDQPSAGCSGAAYNCGDSQVMGVILVLKIASQLLVLSWFVPALARESCEYVSYLQDTSNSRSRVEK